MSCFSSSERKQQSDSKTASQRSWMDKTIELYGKTLGQNKVYGGQTVAPFSDLQTGALTSAKNYADFFATPMQVGTPLGSETGTAIKGLLAGTTGATSLSDADIQNYFTEKHYNPAMKNLKENVNPLIDEAHAGPGYFGSARSNARVKAATDTSDRLSEQRAQLFWDAQKQNQAIEEAKAGRTLSTLDPAMRYGDTEYRNTMQNLEIAATQISGLKELFGFGAAEQTQEQAELQAEFKKWLDENEVTDPENIAILLSLLGQNFSSSSGYSSGPGLGYTAVAGLAGGFGTALGTKLGSGQATT